MSKGAVSVFMILFFIFLTAACAQKQGPTSAPVPAKETSPSAATSRQSWEQEWEKTLQAAKKEGTVILYSTANTTVRTAMGNAFRQKYGLTLESVTGRGAEQALRLINERRNGLYLADVYMAGTTTPVTQLKPAGVLDPMEPALILPEVKDPKSWYGGVMHWVDSQHTILGALAYPNALILANTQMVKQGEIRSLRDLLSPVWKGKIVINDPTVPGSGSKSFSMLGWVILNMDYWRQFARQEPVVMRDQRALVEWVARGKYPVSFAPRAPEVTEFKTAGAPIELLPPSEGTYLTTGSAGIALIGRAAHPNAAKVFLNWFLSREGQTVFTRAHGGHSARIDVPTEGLDPDLTRQAGVKYFIGADSEDFLVKEDKSRELAMEIFGPLMK